MLFRSIVLIAVLVFLGFMVFLLFRFSSLTRKAIDTQDQDLFSKGLRSLKLYFMISGILALLGLLINLFSLTSL